MIGARRHVVAGWLGRLASLAFAALVVVMPWRLRADPFPHPTSLYAPLTDVVFYLIDGLIVATLGLWLLARLADRRPIRGGPRAVWMPAIVLVGLAWLSLPFGVLPALSLFGAIRLTVLVLLAAYVINEVDGLGALAIPLGLTVGIQAAVAIGQFVNQGSLGLTGLGELHLNPAEAYTSVVLREDGARILRAYALSAHPNVAGGFFAADLLLLLGWRPRRSAGRAFQLIAVALAAAGILVTFSRGAWLGLAAGAVALVVIVGLRAVWRDRRHWLAIGGLAVVVLVAGGWQLRGELAVRTGLASQVTATERQSVDERVAQIELGWWVLQERPILGVGMSAVPVEMQRLGPAFAWAFFPPHLVLLVVAAELGIGGGLAILALLIGPWLLLLRKRDRWNPELAAASGALAAITVVGLFDDYPWVGGPGRTLLWVVVGLWALAWGRAKPEGGPAGAG